MLPCLKRTIAVGWASAAALAALLVGCAPASPAAAAPPDRPIASVHQRQCSRCHAAPEPGTRSRETVESAAARHRKRVRLTPEEWVAMVEFLSAPAN